MEKKSQKKILKGIVVSDKAEKTCVVSITRLKKHKKYHKYHKVTKRYKAHDENGKFKVGDEVLIEETAPISKDKKWKIISLIKKSNALDQEKKEEQ